MSDLEKLLRKSLEVLARHDLNQKIKERKVFEMEVIE